LKGVDAGKKGLKQTRRQEDEGTSAEWARGQGFHNLSGMALRALPREGESKKLIEVRQGVVTVKRP